MSIKIIPAGEPIRIKNIVTLILAPPGYGKTSLANTAADPLLLDFDRGSHRSLGRPNTILIDQWADVADLGRDDLGPYKTLIADTGGRLLEVMAADIISRDGKMGTSTGQPSLKGFGALKGEFRTWLRTVTSWGSNIVIVAHATEERHGDEVKLRVDAQGSSKNEIYKAADLMGRISIEQGKRIIDWNPSDSGFGKNPAGLPREAIPDPAVSPGYLQGCITKTINHITKANEESNAEEERLRELRAHFGKFNTADEFTKRAKAMTETNAARADKAILMAVAKTKGFVIDKTTKVFSDPNAAKPEPEPEPAEDMDEDDDAF